MDATGKGAPPSRGELLDEGKQRASELTSTARDKFVAQAEGRKEQLAHELSNLSERLRNTGGQEGVSAGLTQKAAEWTERAAHTLESRSTDDLVNGFKGQLRDRPGVILGAMFFAGFVTARILR